MEINFGDINLDIKEGLVTGIVGLSEQDFCFDKDFNYVDKANFNVFIKKTVYDELKLAMGKNKKSKDNINSTIRDMMKMVGLNDSNLFDNPNNLSNGEKGLVSLARLLLNDSEFIILKDITCYLDDKSVSNLEKIIKKYKRDFNKTFVIISDDIDFVYLISDEMVIIDNSLVLFQGKKKDVYDRLKGEIRNVPLIIEFVSRVYNKKSIRLDKTSDVKELMKDVYRNV